VKADVENFSARPPAAAESKPSRGWATGLREFVHGLLVLPRDFSPAVRRIYIWRFVLITLIWIALCAAEVALVPMRRVMTERLTFTPVSKAYESLALIGEDESYGAIILGLRAVRVEAVTLPIRLEVKSLAPDGAPARVRTIQVNLPGLQASAPIENTTYRRSFLLDREGLEGWLQRDAGIGITNPAVQAEIAQLMSLLKRYESSSPGSWKSFSEAALNDLTLFGHQMRRSGWFVSSPLFRGFFFVLLPLYVLAMGILGRATRAVQAPQVAAGAWRPPALSFYAMVVKQTLWGGVAFAAIIGLALWRIPAKFPGAGAIAVWIIVPTALVFLLCSILWLIRRWLQPRRIA
jgi:hypothetical protein